MNGILYSHNGSYLISSDEEGDLCLSDATNNYRLQKTIAKALILPNNGSIPLCISPDGKHAVFIGPTKFIVTIIETNTLNQTLTIDISDCILTNNDEDTLTTTDAALFARFAPNRYLYVATETFKLLKFDSYTGRLLQIVR